MQQRARTKFAVRAVFAALWARMHAPREDRSLAVRPTLSEALSNFERSVEALEARNAADAIAPSIPWEKAKAAGIAPLYFVLAATGGVIAYTASVAGPGTPTSSVVYYVTTTGSDVTGDGSPTNPWATAQHGIDQVLSRNLTANVDDVRISIGPGTYWDTAIRVTDANNPPPGHTVTLTATSGVGTVRLVGGHQLDTSGCTVHSGSIMKCPTSATFWTLWENGTRARAARTPNYVNNASFPVASEPFIQAAVGANDYTTLTYNPLDIDPSTWVTADVQIVGTESNGAGVRWFTGVTNVTNVNTGTHVFTFPTQTKYKNGNRYYYAQNDLAMLDQAGEWYLDRTDAHGTCSGQHCLYYWPRSSPITSQEIVYPTTSDTIYLAGTDATHPVKGWNIDGLTVEASDFVQRYRYANWGTGAVGDYDLTACLQYPPDGRAFCLQEMAESYAQHGLIHLANVERVTVSRVHAKNSGFACLYVQLHAQQQTTVRDSWLEHCGFDGIQFEGDVPSIGDSNNYNIVNNVAINNMGELLQHGAGIRFANSGHNQADHVSISQGPRNAIYITDLSTLNQHQGYANYTHVQHFKIDSVGQDTGDMGAIGVFQVGSGTGNTAPLATNYFDQGTIANTAAHPGMTDLGPNCVFFDNNSWNQDIRNTNCTNAAGRRINDSGGHNEVNVSWVGGFNAGLLDSTIGLSPGFPY